MRAPFRAAVPRWRHPADIRQAEDDPSCWPAPFKRNESPAPHTGVSALRRPLGVVQSGYEYLCALLTKEGLEASEDWRTNHAQPLERLAAIDVWARAVTKGLAGSLEAIESWAIELNPGVVEFEAVELSEAWDLILNP